jgi:hypothetical protein
MLIEVQIKQNLNKIRSGDPLIFDNVLICVFGITLLM